MVLCFHQRDSQQLVVSLLSFHVLSEHICRLYQCLALVFKPDDLKLVLVFDIHERLEFILEPPKLFLERDDLGILGQLCVLFLCFDLEEGKFFLDFDHVHFVGKQEVLFMLVEHADKFGIIVSEHIVN